MPGTGLLLLLQLILQHCHLCGTENDADDTSEAGQPFAHGGTQWARRTRQSTPPPHHSTAQHPPLCSSALPCTAQHATAPSPVAIITSLQPHPRCSTIGC